MTKKFNIYFSNVVQNLNIKEVLISEHIEDPNFKAIHKYSKHQTIIAINENCASEMNFSFNTATQLDVFDVIHDIDVRMATSHRNIPSITFKQNIDLYLDIITNMFNNSISECNFHDLLKLADITTAFKKGDVTDKSNYRPVSLLPCVSKLFEKLYSVQIRRELWSTVSIVRF